MKERAQKALLVAVSVAIGITLVTLVGVGDFSLVETGIAAVVSFVVDYLFSFLSETKKK